ncbi:hypothetical protein INR49_005454 [Caranx melampygus]|nr:hypothetical protein INR49_005454 [Caranx melampygus]
MLKGLSHKSSLSSNGLKMEDNHLHSTAQNGVSGSSARATPFYRIILVNRQRSHNGGHRRGNLQKSKNSGPSSPLHLNSEYTCGCSAGN